MNCPLIVVKSWSLHGNSCEITNNDNLGDGIEFGLFEVVESGGNVLFCLTLLFYRLLHNNGWHDGALQRYSVTVP